MKQYMVILPLSTLTLSVALPADANAQIAVVEVIKAGVKKVIKAVDLKVQRLQNKTLWLQNAQKVLETQLSKLKLKEIADWTEKQRTLYSEYYEELWKVKSMISYYSRVKELTERQISLVDEYQWAWGLIKKDKNFSANELLAMQQVYSGILERSIQNLDEVLLVVSSFKTQMSDAERLEVIFRAAEAIQENLSDLKQLNRANAQVSLARAKSLEEVTKLKELYGLL
ncbi:conjugal transfer protein TraI [Pedobacter sp. SYP-B3415]|uniref:conjugal transfer protein TraI n=1 Tax=Pedobacter sp. SYP-B3415 TaxID=2496641 RepID=UPI00101C4FB5|nr:conjugal transfer protein TraI [Pedobacter sp. SYP-B3415]